MPAWLVRVTARRCFQWKRARQRRAEDDLAEGDENLPDGLIIAPALREDAEKERRVREAVARLPERCQQMIRMLFYEHPPRSYQEMAESLGLAMGSLGFVRSRCLKRLRQILEEMDI